VRHGGDVLEPNGRRAIGVGGDQRRRSERVDLARDAVREPEDLAAGVGREHERAVATGDVDVVVDVAHRLVGRERVQPVVHGDALAELAQLVAREVRFQLGLADEEDLHQLVALVFQVREQPDLLEEIHRQVLRLVHHQHGLLATVAHVDEVLLEQHERGGLADPGRQLDAEAQADLLEHLLARERGVGDQRHGDLVAPLVQRVVERRGLAGSHLTGDQEERFAVLDAVAQVRARFLVLAARVHELELVSGGEGVFPQAEVVFEHRSVPNGVGHPCEGDPLGYRRARARAFALSSRGWRTPGGRPRMKGRGHFWAGSRSPMENSDVYG
jgi:hypothetical protein